MAAPLRKAFQQFLILSPKSTDFHRSEKLWRKSVRCISQATAKVERKWVLHSLVYLQRYPIITTPMTEMDKRMQDYFDRLELNHSFLSDHELTIEKEKGISSEDLDTFSALDMENIWKKASEEFKLAPVITEADETNDTRSINRKLDQKLFLIIKKVYNSKEVWSLPHIQISEGESLRETAERALSSSCGNNLKATFLGNAPCGYTKYKLPPTFEEYGVKQFYLKALYDEGDIKEVEDVLEHKWVTLEESKEYLAHDMYKQINQFDVSFT